MEFVGIPIEREELETLYLERLADLLKLKAFLKEKGLYGEYEARMMTGEQE